MTLNIANLKKLAEAATLGPTFFAHPFPGKDGWEIGQTRTGNRIAWGLTEEDAKYYAALHTAAVLELIAEVERLETLLADVGAEHEKQEARADDLEAENKRLRDLMSEAYRCLYSTYREEQPAFDMPPEPADEWSYALVGLFSAIQDATGKSHQELLVISENSHE